jgi:hypothetical protein
MSILFAMLTESEVDQDTLTFTPTLLFQSCLAAQAKSGQASALIEYALKRLGQKGDSALVLLFAHLSGKPHETF